MVLLLYASRNVLATNQTSQGGNTKIPGPRRNSDISRRPSPRSSRLVKGNAGIEQEITKHTIDL